MPDDRRVSISTSARLSADAVAKQGFAIARKGFDPAAVRSFLDHVGRELAAAEDREKELREALADAERQIANPVVDEETLTTALGHETARVLRSAHDAASDLLARAESDASRVRAHVVTEIEQLQSAAEQAALELRTSVDQAAAEARSSAATDAEETRQQAFLESDTLLAQTRADCRSMVQKAQELRARVLGDLSRRRRALHSQIEQLRAGRESFAETFRDVRISVDRIADEIFRAEEAARLAAEAAGREVAEQGDDDDDLRTLASVAEAEASHLPPAATAPGSFQAKIDYQDEFTDGPAVVPEAKTEMSEPELAPEQTFVEQSPPVEPTGAAADAPPKASVEELFARIRAGSQTAGADDPVPAPEPGVESASSVAEPETAVFDHEAGEAPATSGQVPEAPKSEVRILPPVSGGSPSVRVLGASPPSKPGEKAEDATDGDKARSPKPPKAERKVAVAKVAASGADVASEEATAGTDGDGVTDETRMDPALLRRDELLGPVVANLARRLKRALQDDQNDILDRLRSAGSWGPDVLEEEPKHLDRYVRAASEHLAEAARAGAVFGGGSAVDAPDISEIADQLAGSVVGPLRSKLDSDEGSGSADDPSWMAEHVGATFREWKGARVERLAGDQAVAAFCKSILGVGPKAVELQWVVDDDGVECPDCEDNELAGPVKKGDDFPTGHSHPPAHAGCRCLLVAVNA